MDNFRDNQVNLKRPTFLFIGPDKTGSTWLHYILQEHPECFVPPAKDIWFFDKYYEKGLDWYLSFFKDAPEGVDVIGELSHNYLFSPEAAKRIAKDLPEVKLITCLRDPVERTFSQYLYLRRSGVTKKSLREAIEEHPRLINNSLYHKHLSVYFDYFSEEQIKVLWFKDLKSDSEEFAKEIFRLLKVPHDPDIEYDKQVRPAGEPRSFYVAKLLKWAGFIVRELSLPNLVGRVKNNRWVNEIFYRSFTESEKPQIGEEMEKNLREKFSEDIHSLESLLDVDLSHWLEPNNNGAGSSNITHE